jgi:hypothetical protein
VAAPELDRGRTPRQQPLLLRLINPKTYQLERLDRRHLTLLSLPPGHKPLADLCTRGILLTNALLPLKPL